MSPSQSSVSVLSSAFAGPIAAALFLQAPEARAATPFEALAASSDVAVDLAGTLAQDEDVAEDDFVATPVLVGPPDIPASADLAAYHFTSSADLFASDTTIALPGGLTAEPVDVVRWDGASYTLAFDGSASGVPNGTRVDAISLDPISGDLILSFDVSIGLGGFTADDEDLVAFDGVGFTHFFDASQAGVPESLDLDGVHHIVVNGNLAVSFDGSGDFAGFAFDDEDVLEYESASGSWELVFDGSSEHAAWSAADLDGFHLLPEAGSLPGLVGGVAWLAFASGRRSGRRC